MEKLNIDVEKAAKMIEKETGVLPRMAMIMANQLKTLHADLFPVVEDWIEGNKREVDFHGITLQFIMEKEKCSYIQSLYSMSCLMEDPEYVDDYKNRILRWK